MEITASGVSVYEVELDLKQWNGLLSSQVPGFSSALIQLMPSTVEHRCFSGQPGGFHVALAQGTNFGHVVEHVLLELIHLAHPERPRYTGWTRDLGEGRCLIHYGAPDYLTGRLAAILAVDLVNRLQQQEKVDLDALVEQLRHPVESFTRLDDEPGPGPIRAELVLGEGPREAEAGLPPRVRPVLSDWQRDHILRLLISVEERLPLVGQRWHQAFLSFGGEYAAGTADKVELINPDKFISCYRRGDLDACFHGVQNLTRLLRALNIPRDFLVHSLWLYKNHLMPQLLGQFADDPREMAEAIGDVDDFFQNILHAVEEGFRAAAAPETTGVFPEEEATLRSFRARQVRPPRVLVVDDDAMARKVTRSILERQGLRTLGARDGLEALSILAERNGDLGLVLLDLVMPGLDGEVTFRRIRASYPRCRVILMSGYPLDQRQESFQQAHEVEFVAKPFASKELLAKARDLLELHLTGRPALN